VWPKPRQSEIPQQRSVASPRAPLFAIGVTSDSDLERARKLIKQIGLELQKDPEFAPLIIEPVKMQGVDELGDYAVTIRAKMMPRAVLRCLG
jgi:small-conductance mechanosensitive channel